MVKTLRVLVAAFVLSALGAGFLALWSTNASAVENPCDPTPGIIKLCKSQHGHFSFACCCCVRH